MLKNHYGLVWTWGYNDPPSDKPVVFVEIEQLSSPFPSRDRGLHTKSYNHNRSPTENIGLEIDEILLTMKPLPCLTAV